MIDWLLRQIQTENYQASWDDFVELAGPESAAKFDQNDPKHHAFALSFVKLNLAYSSLIVREAVTNGDYVFITVPILNVSSICAEYLTPYRS